MRVYLAGPITEDREDRKDWRRETAEQLALDGIEAVLPSPKETYSQVYGELYDSADAVLTVRDWWYTTKSDVVLANFGDSEKASIGTSIELGWACQARVPIVAVIEDGNVHDHPMVLSVITFRAFTLQEGIRIVQALGGSRL